MIKLTWGQLRNAEFMALLTRLFKTPLGYHLGQLFVQLGEKIHIQLGLYNDKVNELNKKYSEPDPASPGDRKLIEETKNEYVNEMMKLDAVTFDTHLPKVEGSSFPDSALLTPQDYMLLKPILLEEVALKIVDDDTVQKKIDENSNKTETAAH